MKEIKGFRDYFIDSKGIVYSQKRGKLKIIKSSLTRKGGYLKCILMRNGKATHVRIHRLVAEAFIFNSNNLPVVNHKDGNKLNNNKSNLEWVTYANNAKHAYSIGVHSKPKGIKNANSKLKEYQVLEIRKLLENGSKNINLSKKFNVSDSLISSIKTRRYWNHI